MPEQSKKYRAHFKNAGRQNNWLSAVRTQLSISDVAKVCACSERTIRDWQREKYHMDYACLLLLCKRLQLPIPTVEKIDLYAHTQKAGQKGAATTMERYGKVPVDETLRKQAWHQWWVDQGKSQSVITKPKEIHYPKKSAALAEFVGIVLGDGGMTEGQLSITLNSTDDLEYSEFVVHLCKKLFRVNPSVYIRKYQNALVIMISRVALIRFLTEQVGLVTGNKVKHQVAIPDWIMTKKLYQIACLKGLVDTDGSVFTHRYTVNGKQYAYKKLSYTSASAPLKHGAHSIFKTLGMQSRLAGAYDVRLDSKADMKTYFTMVGSHNPKHLKRFSN
jgi:hypothetical protein